METTATLIVLALVTFAYRRRWKRAQAEAAQARADATRWRHRVCDLLGERYDAPASDLDRPRFTSWRPETDRAQS